MGISLKFVFRVKEGNQVNDERSIGYIYLQRIENRKKTYRSLRLPLLEKKYWDEVKQRVKKSKDINYEKYNSKIEDTLRTTLIQNGSFVKLEEENDNRSFIKYFEKVLNGPRFKHKHGTRNKYNSVLVKLNGYLKERQKNDLLFSELTVDFLDDLQTYMVESGMFINSVTNYLKVIQSMVKRSMVDREVMNTNNPFLNFKFEKKVVRTKETLNREEIRLLRETEIQNPRLNKVRLMFVFQFFTGGMRVSDLLTLRFRNLINGKLSYQMFKTDHVLTFDLTPVHLDLLVDSVPLKTSRDSYRTQTFTTLPLKVRKKEVLKKMKERESTKRPTPFRKGSSFLGSLPDFVFLEEEDFQSIPYVDGVPVRLHLSSFSYSELIEEGIRVKEYLQSQGVQRVKSDVISKDGGIYDKKKELVKEYMTIIEETVLQQRKKYYGDVVKELTELGTNPKTKNGFVFQRLDENDFKDVLDNQNFSIISEDQYSKIQRSGIVYNRNLKELQKYLGITKSLKTHLPRTSFTNLMMLGKVSHRDISNTLGHSSIAITDEYLKTGFENPGINEVIQKTSEDHGI